MLVLIDNSNDREVEFFLFENKLWHREKRKMNPQRTLLEILSLVLAKYKKSIHDISGLAVVVGLGRFTATRIAVTVANALGFALKIPVVAVNAPDPLVAKKKLAQAKPGVYVSAKYSAEAHIYGEQKNAL